MAAEQLELILNNLASELQCAVKLDDYPQMRLLAYNTKYDRGDEVFQSAVFQKQVPDSAKNWLNSPIFNIREAIQPVPVAANDELGTRARVCIPIRYLGRLRGHLWLVQPRDKTFSDSDLRLAMDAATAAAPFMHGDVPQIDPNAELLRKLIADEERQREEAASRLVRSGVVRDIDVTVMAMTLHLTNVDEAPLEAGDALQSTVVEVRRQLGRNAVLGLLHEDHALVLLLNPEVHLGGRRVADYAARTSENLQAKIDSERLMRSLVGIGDRQTGLLGASLSYEQAQEAVNLALAVPGTPTVASWSSLAVYRILMNYKSDKFVRSQLHPIIETISEEDDGTELLETLEVWLDSARDASVAAGRLNVHRDTVFHRLHKIQDATGVTLVKSANGEEQLRIHVGLKLARLLGIYGIAHIDTRRRGARRSAH